MQSTASKRRSPAHLANTIADSSVTIRRRTKQSSPLGELFDHGIVTPPQQSSIMMCLIGMARVSGVDACNTTLEVAIFAAVMKFGELDWRTIDGPETKKALIGYSWETVLIMLASNIENCLPQGLGWALELTLCSTLRILSYHMGGISYWNSVSRASLRTSRRSIIDVPHIRNYGIER